MFEGLAQRLPSTNLISQDNEQRDTGPTRLAEKLREMAIANQESEQRLHESTERLQISIADSELGMIQQPKAEDRDPFSFSATILRSNEDRVEHTVARAKMDTGCDENWISIRILDRAGLMEKLEPVESKETYTGFGGESFEPIEKIDITWYGFNTANSRTNTFLVHQKDPFDMVLGSIWITEDSILTLNKPALALRMSKFTKGNVETQSY